MAEIKHYVFFDFEMLCSNTGMSFTDMEAIRLGAVKYDLNTHSLTSFDQYIKPKNSAPLSRFCQNLTGITDDDLSLAKTFPDVLEEFLTWIGGVKKTQFFSWSKSDLSRLKLDSEFHATPEATIRKIEQRYVDLQAVMAKRVTKSQFSVENALKLYGLEFYGEPHNPMYDAYNTFRIYMSFNTMPIQSDLIMVKQFISDEIESYDPIAVNRLVKHHLKQDIESISSQLTEISRMRDAYKFLKKSSHLVEKFDNVVINRSGIFSPELTSDVQLFQQLFNNLVDSYKEHYRHNSKVIIFDDHTINKLIHLSHAI
ncbi:3'-5' exonuclease [Bacillus suaedaesalsae]|uniref:Exonuclease domain-containing protein n=1 Tax=Bacillus suaedaesalsae TaxID=2810349 RepID=A0ABS2DLV7_9BACI|nr:3'-5' exonuclease [Bacillus suaedaesalsae]MBM6619479.1 exonuclease domain-containing protein [Bacillus suaedaesalsae]